MKKLKYLMTLSLTTLLFFCLTTCKQNDSTSQTAATTSTNNSSSEDYLDLEWHIQNSGQYGGIAGEDINASPVWEMGYLGENVGVNVVDDGIQVAHPDLEQNVDLSYSYNYVYQTLDPSEPSSEHGTCVSGLIAARDDNLFGAVGVAPRATLYGLNLVVYGGSDDPETIVDAMTRNMDRADISNNSWGFSDGYGQMETPDSTWHDSIESSLSEGRSGKGMVFMWAAGNGGQYEVDNANYDGFANYYGVNAICAVNNQGQRAFYSEAGANLLGCTPSADYIGSEFVGVITTDKLGNEGYNTQADLDDFTDRDYTRFFSGTSASAPIASGVAALLLSANPSLTWRDIRTILATTARKNDSNDSSWANNSAGYHGSHSYGFGVLDTHAAVQVAENWTSVGGSDLMITEQWPNSGSKSVNSAIPDNSDPETTISSSLTISESNISSLEFVTVTFTSNHSDWGDLEVVLKRDDGMVTTTSILSTPHECYSKSSGAVMICSPPFIDHHWDFGSMRHLGESANAVWTLEVTDKISSHTGTFQNWRLTFYGS